MKPPLLPPVEVPILSEEQVRTLLATSKGNTFEDRCGCAIIYTLADAGLHMSEPTGLRVEDDVDLKTRTLTVLGKGRKPRIVGIGAQATQGLDRYMRVCGAHTRKPNRPELWIGKRGKLTGSGVRRYAATTAAERALAAHRRLSPADRL